MASAAAIARESAEAVQAQMRARGIDDRPTWGTWQRGDMCGIVNEGGIFTFHSVRLDEFGNAQHVWGQSQTKEFRTFDPDRLTTKIRKTTRRRPVEDDE